MSEFNRSIREWLIPLGYTEIYRLNHPTDTNNEVHFTKDNIRVICIKDNDDEYCYLQSDLFLSYMVSLQTQKFKLFEDLSLPDSFIKTQLDILILGNLA